jgi:hypothetical protein
MCTGIERWNAGFAIFLCAFQCSPFSKAILGLPTNLYPKEVWNFFAEIFLGYKSNIR